MVSPKREFVFSLTEEEAHALIEFGAAIEKWTNRNSPLDRATARLDEQLANQQRSWERCPTCGGSGWMEEDA
jgi:hypothetical protein